MKYITLSIRILIALALIGSSFHVLASQGSSNGVPFQELTAEIKANRVLIFENRDAINALETDVSSLVARVSDIDSRLDAVNLRVSNNSAAIEDAFRRIEAAENDIQTLYDDLANLSAQHASDIAAINAELVQIQLDLDSLAQQSAELAALLESQIAEVRDAVSDNSLAIDSLLADIVLINAELTTINTNYDQLTNDFRNLNDHVNANTSQLAGLDSALEALKNRVNTLEVFHCDLKMAVGETVVGTFISTCESVVRRNRLARYYSFTLKQTQTITINMTMTGGPEREADSYLYLHAGTDKSTYIARNDDGGAGYNARLTTTLAAGTYTIEATTYSSYCIICANNTYDGYNFQLSLQ